MRRRNWAIARLLERSELQPAIPGCIPLKRNSRSINWTYPVGIKITIFVLFTSIIIAGYGGGCGQGSGNSGNSTGSSAAQFTVTTNPATNVTTNSAILNGRIVPPNVFSNLVYFQWGTTTNYQNSTPYQFVYETNDITANLSGLLPNTAYNFRLVATNNTGAGSSTQYGLNLTFTTTAAAPSITAVLLANASPFSATLNAKVNANCSATTAYFQWGITTTYGADTTIVSIGNGTGDVNINADISGLSPATTYNFRAVAVNIAGTIYSSNQSFTTRAITPPTVATNPADNIARYSATLKGTANSNGLATTVYFQWGLTTAYGANTTGASIGTGTNNIAVDANISGLSPSATYNFRVVAVNIDGTTYGANQSFTTLALTPPTIVTNPATNITRFTAVLNATVNSNNLGTTAYFQWGLTTGYGFDTASQNIGNGPNDVGITATINGLLPSTVYNFRVVATNVDGTSSGVNLTFTTFNLIAPTAISNPASNIYPYSATLNGTVNPNESATTAYFQWGLTTAYGTDTTAVSVGNGISDVPINTVISGLSPATTYNFRVVAVNATGASYGANQSFTTLALTPPNLATTSASNILFYSATLNGAVNPNGLDATAYFQWGLTTSYGNTTADVSVGNSIISINTSADINGLSPATTYNFRIVASNSAGTTYGVNQSFTTLALTAPSAVTNPASNMTTSAATLNASVNSNGSSTNVYFQWGLTTAYGTDTAAVSAGNGLINCPINVVISGLSPNTTYNFRVVAVNIIGTINGANQSFSTLDLPPTPPSCNTNPAGSITLNSAILNGAVNPNGRDTTAYFQWGLTTSYGNSTPSQSIGNGTTNISISANLGGLLASTTYNFQVVATNASGTTYGANQSFTTLAPPPTAPSAVTNAATNIASASATLNGTVNPNNGSTTVYFQWGLTTSYGNTTSSQSIGNGASNVNVLANISGLSQGTTYNFRVVATNSAGTTNGANQSFTTPVGLGPIVVTGSASFDGVLPDNTYVEIIRGTVNPNGLPTTAYFEWGTTPALGNTTASQDVGSGTTPVSIFAGISELQVGVTYYYRIVATNSGGTSYGATYAFP